VARENERNVESAGHRRYRQRADSRVTKPWSQRQDRDPENSPGLYTGAEADKHRCQQHPIASRLGCGKNPNQRQDSIRGMSILVPHPSKTDHDGEKPKAR
jgi:hypothetical protein